MQKVETKLSEMETPDRQAHFICSLSLVWPMISTSQLKVALMDSLSGHRVAIGGLAMIRFLFLMAMTSPLAKWNLN